MLFAGNVYSQDIYSRAPIASGLEIIYTGKFFYEGDSETAPVLYAGQDGNVYKPGTAVYNPLDLSVSMSWDSTSAYTLTLTGMPESIDYSASRLFAYIASNPRYGYVYYPLPIKSGNNIKVGVISSSDGSTEDIFRIIIAVQKSQ